MRDTICVVISRYRHKELAKRVVDYVFCGVYFAAVAFSINPFHDKTGCE